MIEKALTVTFLFLIAAAVGYGKKRPSAGKLMAIIFSALMLALLSYAVWSSLLPN